ncbi:unnamed protein product [Moneuplotes crassus]|uniref:Amidase domain-containing protein n=1 Tax=Euplotes crassus TaxID=5936 RepID=A0AAD1UEI9_EUPCR|nr:unnamed protein product [Moneuplotes crassus]
MSISQILWYLFLLYLGYKALYWVHFFYCARENYYKGQRIKKERDSKTYDFPPENQAVLECSTIQDLLDGQFSRRFTATDIVNTYANRCYTIGRKHNYTADEMFERALSDAKEKDKQLKDILDQGKNPKNVLGKLHGIPFSVKDHIWVEGTISSCGVSSMTDNIKNKDSYIVQALRKEGAIPLVKGNCSEGNLTHHTTNLVWGEAKNPWDNTRTCGGSSGGDAALVASGCIPFSIGSDCLGSLRIPALFCGIYTLFPTFKRMSAKRAETYLQDNIQNFELLPYAIGPLTRNASDLTIVAKIMFSEDVYEEYRRYPKVPFNKALHSSTGKLKIGILNDVEKISTLSKTAERSIEIASQILEDNDHEVVNVDLVENTDEQSHMVHRNAIYMAGVPLKNKLFKSKDYVGPAVILSVIFNHVPTLVLKIADFLFSFCKGKRTLLSMKDLIQPSAQDIMDFTMQKQQTVEKTIQKWKELGLDALIVPSFPIPAVKSKLCDQVLLMSGAYRLAPFWGFPAGSVPITTVREDEQEYKDEKFNDNISKACAESMKDSKGLPMGVEVICMPYKEEQILRIMELLQRDSNKR